MSVTQNSNQQQIQRVKQEKQNFIDAYNQGKISLSDLQTAVAYSDRQLRELNYQPQVQVPTQPIDPAQPPQKFTYVSPSVYLVGLQDTPFGKTYAEIVQQKADTYNYKQDLIQKFNQINQIPVAKDNEEAIAKGYESYITPSIKASALAEIGQGYDAYKSNVATIISNEEALISDIRQASSAATKLGLPAQVGLQFDLSGVTVPQGAKVSGFEIKQMVGPLLPGVDRQNELIINFASASTTKAGAKQSEASLAIEGKSSVLPPLVLLNRFRVPFTDNPELAQAQSDILGLSRKGVPVTMQGTRLETGPNYGMAYKEYESIYSNLSAENQIALRAWQDEQAFNQLKRTGLGLGAIIAAPIVGPSGVILGVGGGLGISQGIKNISQAVSGEKLTLLTSQEAYEAATAGVLLGGAGKLLSSGLQVAAKGGSTVAKALAEGVGQTGSTVKAVTAAASRVGQNALIGGGANFVLSGGDLKATGEGALFGAGLGAVGEVGGALSNRLLGVKTDILKTYTEASQTQMGGKNVLTQRIATVETARIRLPYEEAIRTQKQLDALTDLRLDLAGSRLKTTTIKRGTDGIFEQVTTGPKQTVRSGTAYDQRIGDINKAFTSKTTLGESLKTGRLENVAIGRSGDLAGSAGKNIISTTRLAEPVLSAVKGERFEIGRVARGKVNEFAGLPKEVKAVETALGSNVKILETVKVSTGEGQILQLGGKAGANKPSVFLEKTTVASKDIFPTETKFTVTKFDTIKLRGTIKDDSAALNFAKNLDDTLAQKIYKGSGGGYRSTQNKIYQALNPKEVKGGPMKPLGGSKGDVPLASRIEQNFKQSQSGIKRSGTTEFFKQTNAITEAAKQVQAAGAKGQSVTLSRPVIKLDFAKGSVWTAATSAKSIWGSTQRTAPSTVTDQRQNQKQPSLTVTLSGLNTQMGKLDGKIDLSPIISETTKSPQRQPELLSTGGTPILNIPKPIRFDETPRPIVFEVPKEDTTKPIRFDETPLPIVFEVPKEDTTKPTRFDETPLPIVFEVPKEDTKTGGGLIPIVGSKPIQSQRDFTGEIRITDTPQKPSQTTDVPQIFRTSSVPKRKLQGIGLFPGGGSGGSDKMFSNRRGKWWKTRNALPNPDQVFKQVLGKKSIDVFKQTKQQRRSSSKRSKGKR